MESRETAPRFTKSFLIILFSLISVKLLLHFYTNAFAGYGIFRDELYYLACTQRPDLGYVDQPPFSIYVLWFFKLILGKSIFAIRAIVAVAGALTIYFTGLIVRRLGGGSIALLLAGSMVLLTPIYLAMNSYYSMNSLDILLWSMAFYMIIRIIQENKFSDWIILGVIVGLGLLNKISMGWLAAGFAIGLLFSGQRKQILTPRPWLAGFIALLLFSPFIIWNLTHNMAHLEFIHNASQYKYSGISRFDILIGQKDMFNPLVLIVAAAGLVVLYIDKSLRKFNILGTIFIVTVLILVINGHSKPEYLSPAFPPLIAAGCVLLERISRNRWMQWLPFVILFTVFIYGIISIPMAMPILSEEKYIEHAKKLGAQVESNEGKELAQLPQFYADMHGWEEMAATVAQVYHALPDSEKSTTIIFGNNYGEAGAMDYYRDKYDLPLAVSNHNAYWIWGEKLLDRPISTVIIIGGHLEDHLKSFDSVEQAAIFTCKYNMPYENNMPIFVARHLKRPLAEIWPHIKHYD